MEPILESTPKAKKHNLRRKQAHRNKKSHRKRRDNSEEPGLARRAIDALHKKRHEIARTVSLDYNHRPPELKLSDDWLGASGYKGYRTILATHPIIEGTYYTECKFEVSTIPVYFPGTQPHIRLGLARSDFDKEYVLGYDTKSYSYRDTDGAIFHNGEGKPFGGAFHQGDVVGILIHMEPPKPAFLQIQSGKIDINEGSKVLFFVNGVCQGEAFADIRQAFYCVGVSLYMNAQVRFNFGPTYEFPPDVTQLDPKLSSFKPYGVISSEPKKYGDLLPS